MYLLWNVWINSVMRMQMDIHKLWHWKSADLDGET